MNYIQSTPTLKGKDAERFYQWLEEQKTCKIPSIEDIEAYIDIINKEVRI